MIIRYLKQFIEKDLFDKIILLSGPRQVGKTTLSKQITTEYEYLNFDDLDDRLIIQNRSWNHEKSLIIFDEIHKKIKWKSFLKGLYDKNRTNPQIIATGSSRLNILKKVGDSLAGRYFEYQLFPLDLKELKGTDDPLKIYERLLKISGFPEPYLKNSENFYNKWKKTHLNVVISDDIREFFRIDVNYFALLIALLKSRVGSPLSINSLRQDLERDNKTIKNWIAISEQMYICFRIFPYSKKINRSILKESKLYFYDVASIKGDDGVKLENLVALSLYKEVCFCSDAKGIDIGLYFLRTKDKKEIDFLILRTDLPAILIEVKLKDSNPSPNFKQFEKYFPNCLKIQLVKEFTGRFLTKDGIYILNALDFLTNMDFEKEDLQLNLKH